MLHLILSVFLAAANAQVSGGNPPPQASAYGISGGAAGQVPYQTGAGATGFTAAGTANQVLQSNGTSAPTWTSSPTNTTLTLSSAPLVINRSTITTTANASILDVQQSTSNAVFGITVTNTDAVNNNNTLRTRSSRGGSGAMTAIQSGDVIGQLDAAGYDGADWSTAAATIRIRADGNFSATSHPASILFRTTPSGSNALPTERMRINNAGSIGIGTTNPSQLFDVNGGTFTASSGGVIAAPSQPHIFLSQANGAQKFAAGGSGVAIFWDTIDDQASITFDSVNSSNTVTVQSAGLYFINCMAEQAGDHVTAQNVLLGVSINGTSKAVSSINPVNTNGYDTGDSVTYLAKLAAADTITCTIAVPSLAAALTADAKRNRLSIIKVW